MAFDGTLIIGMSKETLSLEKQVVTRIASRDAGKRTACAIPLSAVIRRRPCFIRRSKDGGACQANRLPSYLLDVQLAVLLEELGNESPLVLRAATTYAAFINAAFDAERGRFRNFMTIDRRWST